MPGTEPQFENTEYTQDSTLKEDLESRVSPIPVLPQLSVALSLLIFVFAVTYMGASSILTKDTSAEVRVDTLPASPAEATLQSNKVFDDVVIGAKSAIVWDVEKQRILFNKNADERRPLASITKLMTALISYELLEPTASVPITREALSIEGDSGFTDGEQFSLRNLADLTLIESSNDGAAALGAKAGSIISEDEASEVFVHAMNVKATELGLSKTSFKNSSGLDISETEAGAYGSARDVALLMEYIITNAPDAVALTTQSETHITNKNGEYHTAKNTNTVVDELEGLIASKTGYTTLSGGNLVVAVNVGLNRPIIVVVLGSSYDGRFDDTLELVSRARQYTENEAQ